MTDSYCDASIENVQFKLSFANRVQLKELLCRFLMKQQTNGSKHSA